MKKNEFVEYLIYDQLGSISGMSAKAMFGGFGIYREGVIVGIIADDELYLKVDESNKTEYLAMGSSPFVYDGKAGKRMTMSYFKIPPDVLEDSEKLARLVDESCEISLKKSVEKAEKIKPKKI